MGLVVPGPVVDQAGAVGFSGFVTVARNGAGVFDGVAPGVVALAGGQLALVIAEAEDVVEAALQVVPG